MNIVAISDTHNMHKRLTSTGEFPNKLPNADLLIHAGDFSGQGMKGEVIDFIKWLKKINCQYKYGIVFIAGNHDRSFDPKFARAYENSSLLSEDTDKDKPIWLKEILSDLNDNWGGYGGIHYLENSSIEIEGVKIWGSPITPWFHGDRWAFNKYRNEEIKQVWDKIPMGTDIVVTHGPVAYKLDYIAHDNMYVGCEDLRYAIKRVKPAVHISGHIHEGYGVDYDADTNYINASICNHRYDPINKPIVFDLIDGEVNFKL